MTNGEEHGHDSGATPATDAPATAAPDVGLAEVSSDDRTMGLLCHLLGIFTGFLGPLIIWLIKKDSSAFVDDQGKEALNFQITVFIALAISSALIVVIVGCITTPLIGIAALILSIMAAVAANKGERYRYPFAIRLIK